MRVIYKYPLGITGFQQVLLPPGAKLLTVQAQRNLPRLWALVDPESLPTQLVGIRMIGTGNTFDDPLGQYLGTIQLHYRLVFHYFSVPA